MARNDRLEAQATADERVDQAEDDLHVSPFRAWFAKVATKVSEATGSAWAFSLAMLVIVVWLVTGPVFGFSDTWQLVINTGTTIVTFLMVFLIQNTQNRDAKATQLKLDELIRAVGDARNEFIAAEEEPDEELEREKQAVVAEKNKAPQHSSNGEPARHH
jgi:low affinity Fe/Cu permease